MSDYPCDIKLIDIDGQNITLRITKERKYELCNFYYKASNKLNIDKILKLTSDGINFIIENIDDVPFFIIKLCLVIDYKNTIDIYIEKIKTKNPQINNEIVTIIIATTKTNVCSKSEYKFICKNGCLCNSNYTEYLFDKLIDETLSSTDDELTSIYVSNIAILLNVTSLYSNKLYDICIKLRDKKGELKKLVIVGKLYSSKYLDLFNCPKYLEKISFKMIKMTEGIYLGDNISAINQSLIIDNNIKNIISLISINKTVLGVEYLCLPIDDTPLQNLDTVIDTTIKFIEEKINKNENILCHCARGLSRSPAIIMAYLMKTNRWSFIEAYNFIKDIDGTININIGFIKQLKAFEKKV
jgi:hypothetical protein